MRREEKLREETECPRLGREEKKRELGREKEKENALYIFQITNKSFTTFNFSKKQK